MAKSKKVVSRCEIGFLDVRVNGRSVLGGGVSYSRTQFEDGRVVEQSKGITVPPGVSPVTAMADAIAGVTKRRRRRA